VFLESTNLIKSNIFWRSKGRIGDNYSSESINIGQRRRIKFFLHTVRFYSLLVPNASLFLLLGICHLYSWVVENRNRKLVVNKENDG